MTRIYLPTCLSHTYYRPEGEYKRYIKQLKLSKIKNILIEVENVCHNQDRYSELCKQSCPCCSSVDANYYSIMNCDNYNHLPLIGDLAK